MDVQFFKDDPKSDGFIQIDDPELEEHNIPKKTKAPSPQTIKQALQFYRAYNRIDEETNELPWGSESEILDIAIDMELMAEGRNPKASKFFVPIDEIPLYVESPSTISKIESFIAKSPEFKNETDVIIGVVIDDEFVKIITFSVPNENTTDYNGILFDKIMKGIYEKHNINVFNETTSVKDVTEKHPVFAFIIQNKNDPKYKKVENKLEYLRCEFLDKDKVPKKIFANFNLAPIPYHGEKIIGSYKKRDDIVGEYFHRVNDREPCGILYELIRKSIVNNHSVMYVFNSADIEREQPSNNDINGLTGWRLKIAPLNPNNVRQTLNAIQADFYMLAEKYIRSSQIYPEEYDERQIGKFGKVLPRSIANTQKFKSSHFGMKK